MKVCLAQVRSEKGAIERNVAHHVCVLAALEAGQADLVVFPELSLTNYAPDVAADVALAPGDRRLDPLRRLAEETGTTIAAGAPVKTVGRPLIALLVFAPGGETTVIGKRHLHADELPYFTPSPGSPGFLDVGTRVGVAICYEISVAEHTDALVAGGAALYLASVAKTVRGVAGARATLAETARRHRLPALMVNAVGTCEGKRAGGGTMAVDPSGALVARLGSSAEGLLIYDTETRKGATAPAP